VRECGRAVLQVLLALPWLILSLYIPMVLFKRGASPQIGMVVVIMICIFWGANQADSEINDLRKQCKHLVSHASFHS
jgi:hypothetical protein